MYFYAKNVLFVLISIYALKSKAQPSFGSSQYDQQYTINIGGQKITPTQNVDNFSSIKKGLANNSYNGVYHVIVQFNDAPNKELNAHMAGKILPEIALSKNTYISAISASSNKKTLKKLNVRAVLALSPQMKIDAILHQSKEQKINVNILAPNNLREDIVKNELSKFGADFTLKVLADSVNK